MKLIIDANIVFSAMLNTNGKIANILSNNSIKYIAPDFLKTEIRKYHTKIAKHCLLNIDEVQEIEYYIFQHLIFISEEQIEEKYWNKAYSLVNDIDEKDTPYLAYALKFKCKLWTGDKKLSSGLKKKNYALTIQTNELFELINSKDNA